jgi:protein-tyrosine phosphatase
MKPLNSDTHPLLVDFLPANIIKLPGQIGMTIAPGKQHNGMHVPWQRDLEKDLIRLRKHYRTDLLVSLIEAQELEQLQIPDLFERIQLHEMQSQWFPIQDFGTPTSMPDLVELVDLILATVKQGQTVVIHCRGGLGRSGLVVAACLVALGYSPEEAFGHIRQARPGSVETPEQEAYVYEFERVLKDA